MLPRQHIAAAICLSVAVSLVPHARAQTACCLPGECRSVASQAACGSFGGIYFAGQTCQSGVCGAGACCTPTNCNLIDAYNCLSAGRTFGGAGTTCLDDPCQDNRGACCTGQTCTDVSSALCSTAGGLWLGAGTNCGQTPCVGGSCCLPGECRDVVRHECRDLGGVFSAGDNCAAPDVCDVLNDCPNDALFGQTPANLDGGTAGASEESRDLRRWDNFSGLVGAIGAVRWWGLDLRFNGSDFDECVEPDNTFTVAFHADRGGRPGDAVCMYTLVATRTPTGIMFEGIELNEYQVTLPAPCILATGWISVVGLGDVNCWFLWLSSHDGDNRSYCDHCVEGSDQSGDFAFCLLGRAGGVKGACCNLSTGVCIDEVALPDCADVDHRFIPDKTCGTLNVPCVPTPAPCCLPDGSCQLILATTCAGQSGTWLGADADCDHCPILGACCLDSDTCTIETEATCILEDRTWLGAGSSCNQCPAAPECPSPALYSLLPDGPGGFTAGSSESSSVFRRSQFYAAAGVITDLTWWGVDLEPIPGGNRFIECVENDSAFDITFHEDAAGRPGAAICTYTVVATRTPFGLNYLGTELNEYHASLPTPCGLPLGWISIVGRGDPDCWFLWMSAGGGGSFCEGCHPNQQGFGLSLCLQGPSAGLRGVCCNDAGGLCQANVDISDCLDPASRFRTLASCAALDPPCGVIVGACCYPDATCQIQTAADCQAGGGDWLGAHTICVACPCLTPCPADGIIEGEPVCGPGYEDALNGGCSATVPAFMPITLGQTICGQGGVFLTGGQVHRDLDWYELIVTESTELSWSVEAEFPIRAWLINGNFGCVNPDTLRTDADRECTPVVLRTTVGAGTWWLVVGAEAFADSAVCGARYTASLRRVRPCDNIRPGDFNLNGVLDGIDAIFLVEVVLGGGNPTTRCIADMNADGVVNGEDLRLFVTAFLNS